MPISTSLHRANTKWRDGKLKNFSAHVRDAVLEQADSLDYRNGNLLVGALSGDLTRARLGVAYDEERIRDCAENYARLCRLMSTNSDDLTRKCRQLEKREDFAAWIGVAPPSGKALTIEGRTARLDCPQWWRRQLRKLWTRAAEAAMRDMGIIRKGREPYASEHAVRHRAGQKRRAAEFLESSVVVNEQGEQLSLVDVAAKSITNPALRRGEFMCRVRGFEELARDQGHRAEFVTLTAPSAFHAQLAKGGRNPQSIRATVRAAQAWMLAVWARVRAKLKRLSIIYYGFRVTEPHHDGTPHWHALIFVSRHSLDALRAVIAGYWLAEYGDERGAREHRVKFEAIDPAKGSAVAYIAKYVAKNIDAKGEIENAEDHETGAPIVDGIARVDAWASIHGIRQFAQLGGVPVGLWREARRLREPCDDVDIERARLAADRGDWRAFSYAADSEGNGTARRTALKLEKAETGEANRYGELRPPRIIGLRYASAVAITRPHRWRIERKGSRSFSSVFSHLGPVAITVRFTEGAGNPSVWSNPMETSQAGPMYE
jgi:hypothetical protein